MILGHVIRLGDGMRLGMRRETEKTGGLLRGRRCFLGFALPSANDVARNRQEMVGRHQRGGRNRRRLIDDSGLDQSLNTMDSRSLYSSAPITPTRKVDAYINNAAEGTDSVRAVENITTHGGILHDNTRRHNHILGSPSKLLQDEIDHLAQRGILVLEQLRNAEEERGSLVRGELLPGEQEDGNFGQERATCSRGDGRSIEQSSWNQACGQRSWFRDEWSRLTYHLGTPRSDPVLS